MNPLPALGIASAVGLGRSVSGIATQTASGFANLLRSAVKSNPEPGTTTLPGAAADAPPGPGGGSGSANGGRSTTTASLFGPSGLGVASAPGAADRLQQTVRRETQGVQARIAELLAANGIDLRIPVRLHVATDGTVRVAGEHPQRAQIESLLQGDPDLRTDLATLGQLVQRSHLLAQSANLKSRFDHDPDRAAAALDAFAAADTSGFDLLVGSVAA